MLTKEKIKYYSSLSGKKGRASEKKFLVEGKKLILEALNSGFEPELIILSNVFEQNEFEYINNLGRKYSINLQVVKDNELEKIADTKTPQGIIGIFFEKSSHKSVSSLFGNIIAFENINDPGNMGTMIRNSDWFGFENILLNETCTEIFSPKTIRSSAGSVFHLNIIRSFSFVDDLVKLRSAGYSIFTADIKGNDLYGYDFPERTIIVFCNEANGPSSELLKITDDRINIKRFGKAESLNVANANAIILSELRRKI
ncbi:MAG: RNA methyltransferase [Melioribacteraceae bacterium]